MVSSHLFSLSLSLSIPPFLSLFHIYFIFFILKFALCTHSTLTLFFLFRSFSILFPLFRTLFDLRIHIHIKLKFTKKREEKNEHTNSNDHFLYENLDKVQYIYVEREKSVVFPYIFFQQQKTYSCTVYELSK